MTDKEPQKPQRITIDPIVEKRVDDMMVANTAKPGADGSMATAPEIDSFQDSTVTTASESSKELATNAPKVPESRYVTSQLDDPLTDSIVNDIVVREGDELLAVRDSGAARQHAHKTRHQGFAGKIKGFFGGWWHNKFARYSTILLVLAGVGVFGTNPQTRYYTMNAVGIRTAASLTILDNTTQLPLKNVAVELGDRTAKTNQDGLVLFSDLQLGTQALSVKQVGFSVINSTVTLGWGSNPLGEFTLDAVGAQFRFKLVDYLTGKPVVNAEISSGDANAQTDENGLIVLTTDKTESKAQKATIKAGGYRSEGVLLETGQKQSRVVTMVSVEKVAFISKQSGRYDLYKMDIDGKNKQLLLAGTGHEDADISLVQQAGSQKVAMVSRRDTTKNQDGFPLQSLTLIDIEKGTLLKLDHSERIRIVDWIQDKLVYVKIKAGTSAGNPERYQLMSYDYETIARVQLAAANYFNDVITASGNLYFSASNNFQGGNSQFVKIRPDNTGRQVLLDKIDVWNIRRTAHDSLVLSALQGSYTYKIGDPTIKKVGDTPGNSEETRLYLDAPDGKQAIWTENRDGKGVLLVHNITTGKDTVLATQSGLGYPVRWLNARTVVYRVATSVETADYVISVDGGPSKKVTDLTGTDGYGRWNYR